MNRNIILFAPFLNFVFASILISAPFDNFWIECPQSFGAQRLSVRMVESQGSKRQDTVFALSCNAIHEIYPWENIPQGVVDLEREDCHYTSKFDPIMDTAMNYSCTAREYIAGISRVTDTRIQVMCCKMRSRDEANCESARFGKPIGFNGRVEIELSGKLINSLSIEKNTYHVRFCDLVPRNVDAILTDVRSTTTRKPTATPTTTATTVTTTAPPVSTTISPTTTIPIMEENGTESLAPAVQVPVKVNQALVVDKPELTPLSDNRLFDSKLTHHIPIISVENILETPAISGTNNAIEEEKQGFKKTIPSLSMSDVVTHRSTVEVPPLPMPNFPTNKTNADMEKAEMELMSTITELLLVKTIAKNIINKVRSSDVKQQKHQQMAEQLLREIEGEDDPNRGDALFKHSIEMLNELLETKAVNSSEGSSNEMLQQSSFEDDDFVEPPVESEPEENIIAAATLENSRRAPSKHHKLEVVTLPSLDTFPSPPPQPLGRHRSRLTLLELPKSKYEPAPTRNRPRPFFHILDFDEYEEAIRPSTSFTYLTRSSHTSKAAAAHKALASNQPYIDEETQFSPFEGINETRVVPKTTTMPESYNKKESSETTTSPYSRSHRYHGRISNDENSPFEIRRSPMPRGPSSFDKYYKTTAMKHRPTNIEEISKILTKQQKLTSSSEQIVEEHVDMPDGVKTFHSEYKAPVVMPNTTNVDTLVPMEKKQPDVMISSTIAPIIVETTATTSEMISTTPTTTTMSTVLTTEELTTTVKPEIKTSVSIKKLFLEKKTTATYDPNIFFHTPKVAKTRKPERFLTFCTKDRAIRDSHNMIVACGAEEDIWNPPRCPSGTECFYTHDSTYRICCLVSRG